MGKIVQAVAGVILGLGATLLARAYGVPVEVQIAVFVGIVLITLIGWPFGMLVGHFLSRGSDVDTNGFKAIAWANLVAWFIPLVGMVIGGATYILSRRSESSRPFYSVMCTVGWLLAAANSAWGGGASVYEQLNAFAAADAHQMLPATTERSWPRCQFAAIEAWSEEDVATYCRNHEPTPEDLREMERLAQEYENGAAS